MWAGNIGSDSTDYGNKIVVDASGNIYTGGSCMRTVDFDISAGIFTLSPASGNINEMDAFVSKRDASGNVLWAHRFGDTLTDLNGAFDYNSIMSIAVDSSGNVYALGHFAGTVDFDPGTLTNTLISTTSNTQIPGIFILKLDAAGNFVWVKELIGNYQGNGTSMAADAAGNVCLTGYFRGTLDADPASAVQTITSSDYGCFVLKLSTSGSFVWCRKFSSNVSSFGVIGRSIVLDSLGNVYTTGNFDGLVDFDPGSGTTNLNSINFGSVFVLKLTASGNLGWVKQINARESTGITADASHLYITGSFRDTVDFDPGVLVHNLTATGNTTIFASPHNQFVLKLDLSGNYRWATNIASEGYSESTSISVDKASNVYAVGYFNGKSDFDPGTGSFNVNSQGDMDGFLLKLDPLGNFVWAKTISGTADDLIGSIDVDGNANIYTTGFFQNTCDFNPDTNSVTSITSNGRKDAFIFKWGQCLHTPTPIDITSSQNKNICSATSASLSAGSSNSIGWYASATASNFISTGISYVTPTLSTGNYTYYIADLTCGSAKVAITVSVNDCTGITELEDQLSSASLYPVPTHDGFITLSITSLDKNTSVAIYNSLGELIFRQTILSESTPLDLSEKPSGIYFVRISKNNNALKTVKVIRN